MQSTFRPIIPMESNRDLCIQHISGLHPISVRSQPQCGAKLGHAALALQSQLHNAPHDTDNVRSHLIRTAETLLLTVNNTRITKIYCPHLLIDHLKEDPQLLSRTLSFQQPNPTDPEPPVQ